MLTGVEDDQHVHLGPQFHRRAGRRVPGDKPHVAHLVDHYLAEEIERRGQVARAEAVLRQLDEKLVVGVAVERVAVLLVARLAVLRLDELDRKSTRLNSSHSQISYAVFCLKKKKKIK